MANVKLVFYGTQRTNETELVCYVNQFQEVYIEIDEQSRPPIHITLDKSTAIKLAKSLRTEINKMKEVCNE